MLAQDTLRGAIGPDYPWEDIMGPAWAEAMYWIRRYYSE
jgi:hypothetical protein